MMNRWLLRLSTLLFLTLSAPPCTVHADDDDPFDFNEEIPLDFDLPQKKLPHHHRALLNFNQVQEFSILLEQLKLQNPLWTSTKPEKGRDILYLMPSKITAIEYGGGSCNLFFNMTPKMHLTGNNLLNVDQLNLTGIALNLLGRIPGVKNPELLGGLLPLVKKITLQERKVGSYFQAGLARGPFILQFHSSLQIGERNFWLNKKDLEEVKELNNFIFGDSKEFDQNNLYRIHSGLGDTRVKIGLNTINSRRIQTDAGLECIIPTSRASRKKLAEVNLDAELGDDITLVKTLSDSLFNIRDYLLFSEIGNSGHFGLGFYIESKIDLFKGLGELISRVSFDKFFESNEQRLLLRKQHMSFDEFINAANAAAGAFDDAMARAAGITFGKQYLLPGVYTLGIEPGGIFNTTFMLSIPYKKFHFRYGYDFYFQQAERFKKLYSDNLSMEDLNTDLAMLKQVVQHKMFSETTYRIKNFNNIELDIGLGADTTIFAHNIGKDWSIYLKFASSF